MQAPAVPLPAAGPAAAGMQAELAAQLASQLDAHMALPALREDLALHPGAVQADGSPSWMIEDPLKARYYRIGWLEFEMLSRWALGDARQVAERMAQETLLSPTLEEVLGVRQFLAQHELLVQPELLERVAKGEHAAPSLATRALHQYLMFRIPLVNPDRFLQRSLPLVRPLLGQAAWWLSVLAAVVGLLLIGQQWEAFASTFVETLSLQGLLSYAVALAGAKVLHELGHAYTARNLGLRVPRMGVAFVLLFPMLYTDTGETWRLRSRRARFAIASAGMRIELMLAAWCTLAWVFLPEGALRSAVFFLGTTSWLMTLAINASPFMRFDGYYMMSDATGIANLHDEAARQVRHLLRARLLGWAQPAPTIGGLDAPRWLLWFGLATAVYRFFLFIGIAVMVYHYFFKALGIFLFAVEIWWFILRPIWNEVALWWKDRTQVGAAARWRLAALLVLPLAVLMLPWQTQVQAEGWLRAAQEHALYAPRAARLDALPTEPAAVALEQPLVALSAADLALREARAQARLGALDSQLQAGVSEPPTQGSLRSTREQRQLQVTDLQGAGAEARQLRLAAPFAGQLVDVARELRVGQVVSSQEVLGRVIDTSAWIAEVFVGEDQLKRLAVGARALAYVHGVDGQVIAGQVRSIDSVPLEQLPAEMLADKFGGRLLTVEEPGSLKPRRSLYRVRVDMAAAPPMQQARLAAFAVQAERVSLADSLWRGALSALMLQASF